jgi:DNA (cytosine-5)-methyltransferase 1
MIYGSVCSGIEAASVAWHPLGWQPAFFSEIEAFPRAVLSHRFPEVPLHGDFTTIAAGQYRSIDLLVGGTPCQDFSIAGKRAGMDGARGNLTLEYIRLADRLRPRWIAWENVPGVLSSNGGRDFGAFLGALGELGYGFAWRVLDAQYVRVDGLPRAVPQRRERVFLVGHLGDWRPSAAVLFEPEGMRGDHPPRRETGQGASRAAGGGPDGGRIAGAVTSKWAKGTGGPAGDEAYNLVAFSCKDHGADASSIAPTLRAMGHSGSHANAGGQVAVAFGGDVSRTLSARHDSSPCADRGQDVVAQGSAVRRFTPRECERLQGFPDDWTLVPYRGKPAADGPRYKALGNSKAVNVVRWIGRRIDMVDAMIRERTAA